AGKLARHLKGLGHQPVLVAADLQRPNAVNQLQVLGERAGVEVYAPQPGNGAGDPVEVARDSVEHARRHMRDIVIVDTAGRLGMGDVLTLIEQAELAFEDDQKERMAAKMLGGESFTLEDFLDQLIAVRRMGPIANVLAMMPGMGQVKDQLAELDDKHFDRITAIIRSMT